MTLERYLLLIFYFLFLYIIYKILFFVIPEKYLKKGLLITLKSKN